MREGRNHTWQMLGLVYIVAGGQQEIRKLHNIDNVACISPIDILTLLYHGVFMMLHQRETPSCQCSLTTLGDMDYWHWPESLFGSRWINHYGAGTEDILLDILLNALLGGTKIPCWWEWYKNLSSTISLDQFRRLCMLPWELRILQRLGPQRPWTKPFRHFCCLPINNWGIWSLWCFK